MRGALPSTAARPTLLTSDPGERPIVILGLTGPGDLRGGFKMDKKTRDIVTVEIPRSTDMHAENWYSGDHHATLDVLPIARWQRAHAVDLVVSQQQTAGNADASTINSPPPPRRPSVQLGQSSE